MIDNKTLTELHSLTGWVRKPIYWSDIGEPIPLRLLEGLKQYRSSDLGIAYNIGASFHQPLPEDQFFLVAHAGGVYLVDTGGTYVRYIRYVGEAIKLPTAGHSHRYFAISGVDYSYKEVTKVQFEDGADNATYVNVEVMQDNHYILTTDYYGSRGELKLEITQPLDRALKSYARLLKADSELELEMEKA